MRRAARTDTTQQAIVAALRAVGCDVLLLFRVGAGCPDLLCWSPYTQRHHLIEAKSRGGSLTPAEEEWIAGWGGPVSVVRTEAEALRAVGVAAADQTLRASKNP